MLAVNPLLARVHQHKAACTIGVLHHASLQARLTEQGRMLIPCHGRHGNGSAKNGRIQHTNHLAGIHHLRQARPGNIQDFQQFIIPILGLQVEHHGTACVGGIRHMGTACHQMPGKEAVHRAKAQLTGFRLFVEIQMIQQPGQLGAGKIGIGNQSRLPADHFPVAFLQQPFHVVGGAAALPHNSVVNAGAGFPIPQQGGFPLVGNADGRNVPHVHATQLHRFTKCRDLGGQNIVGIMLHPARLGIVLWKFHALGGQHVPCRVEYNRPGAGRPLVQCYQYLLCHIYLQYNPNTRREINVLTGTLPLNAQRLRRLAPEPLWVGSNPD